MNAPTSALDLVWPADGRDLLAGLQQAVDRSDHEAVDSFLGRLEAMPERPAGLLPRARAAASHSLYRRNLLADAAQMAAAALDEARSAGDAQARADSLIAWARIEWAAGNLDVALTYLEEVALLGLPDLRMQTHLNNLLGLVHADLGQAGSAENYHRVALDAARRSGLADLQMIALTNLAGRLLSRGSLAHKAGQQEESKRSWAELDKLVAQAEALAEAHDQSLALPHILVSHGDSLVQRGQLDEAQQVFSRQREIVERYADRSSLTHAAACLARLHRLKGETEAARQALVDGIVEAQQLGARAREAALHLEVSALEEASSHFREALYHHKRYHALREECSLESAHRKSVALSLRMQTGKALREAREQRQRAQALAASNDRLRLEAATWSRAAYVDALTGVGNRRLLDEQLPILHRAARMTGEALALVLLDVDHFKTINDRCSHAIGDLVLKTLGQLIVSHFREGDLCARFGGEEFVILLPGVDESGGLAVCERLRERIQAYDWGGIHPGLSVTVSLGLADIGRESSPAEGLAKADERLYAAKSAGRNRVVAFA